MNFLHKIILLFPAAALLLGACSKEPAADQMPGGTRLCLTLDGGSISVQSTRAVSESAVNDLWVLQFNASGTQLTRQYISSITDPASIELTTALNATANSTLYLVANTGNASLFSRQTLAKAKAVTVALTTTTGGGIPSDASTALPMVGQSAALTFPVTSAIPVNLTRAVAKVTLTVKNLLTTGYPKLTVTSTQLKNVSKSYSTQAVDATNGFTGTTYYPAAAAANFTSYTATTGDITAAGTTTTYYVTPNVRGVGTATQPHLKSDATAASGQGDYCTYVEILGTAQTSASAPTTDVRYRLYLGGNNTNDFNLQSNTAYKVGIELAGLYTADARLTITTDKFDLIQGGTDGDHTGDVGGGWRPLVIGDFRDGGIVYWIDGANYKVVSLDETSSIKWAAANTYVVSGAQSDANGRANSKAIKDYFEANSSTVGNDFAAAFPAAAACYNYTGKDGTDPKGTWYLPAKSELQYLWCAYNGKAPISWASNTHPDATPDSDAKVVFNQYLTTAGGTSMTSGGFWSSTESSDLTNLAWYVGFSGGHTSYINKGTNYYVRCVRDL